MKNFEIGDIIVNKDNRNRLLIKDLFYGYYDCMVIDEEKSNFLFSDGQLVDPDDAKSWKKEKNICDKCLVRVTCNQQENVLICYEERNKK